MMKKVLLYVATAIFLGAVTMVAPLMILKPAYLELTASRESLIPAFPKAIDEGELLTTRDDREVKLVSVVERVVSPSNLSSVGLMLIPSLLLALGVSLYFKKQMF